MRSADGVLRRGCGPIVLLRVSDSGDCFLTVEEKARLMGRLVFIDFTTDIKVRTLLYFKRGRDNRRHL